MTGIALRFNQIIGLLRTAGTGQQQRREKTNKFHFLLYAFNKSIAVCCHLDSVIPVIIFKVKKKSIGSRMMANVMVKTRRPFDLLLNWNEYINYINQEFSEPEENSAWSPKVEIREKNGRYLLRMDLPGVELNDVHVNYSNGYLTIEGQRNLPKAAKGQMGRACMTERTNDRFKRVLKFPSGIDLNNIRKVFKNGILEISIPISDPVKKAVNASEGDL